MLRLDGVVDANVNFAASKVSIEGETTIEELEKAGSFENLEVVPENQSFEPNSEPFWKRHFSVLLSLAFLIAAFTSHIVVGEDFPLTTFFYLASIVVGGTSLFITGFKNLIRLKFDMRTLMTIAIIGAVIIGEWGEGAVVVILFAISEALESYSMNKARNSIRSLMDLSPKEALVRRNGVEQTVHVDDIEIDDTLIVKPGEKIAMDGEVIKGHSTINQAAITGESMPVEKKVSDEVFAGTLNEEGVLEIRVTKRVEDTTLSKIIHLVEEAQDERAPSQAFVDRFAAYYTPMIILVAIFVAIVPPLFFQASWEAWVYQGLAVLVVGCPCALVISTPVSVVTAIGTAARNGVLIKGGAFLEEAGALKAIAFDKTGTLTRGEPAVTDVLISNGERDKIFAIAAALERNSQHPLASAIVKKVEQEKVPFHDIDVLDFQSLTGKGVKGLIDEVVYYMGSPGLFKDISTTWWDDKQEKQVKSLQQEGNTVLLLGTEEKLLGIFSVADQVRETSARMIKDLHNLGMKETIMLTGDNRETAEAIGRKIGVSSIQANLMPEDKVTFMKKFTTRYKKAAMVGDGVNDAPALASSTVGIAMGGAGTDTALETADIALMGDDLDKLPFTIQLSRRSLNIIKQNIGFSLAIKALALLLVIPGWLTLWIAIFADMGATLLVTLNGLRLLKTKK
ncbi:Cd2+/Zn2+-exporting ATPase [Alteribacillus bidgolensis]|uniref:Cd(2+)-exporting ATPase n=1 Tax=Alteribacillus bidgolensis TaxID=930129 RepID=A0A1G8RP63_9BACI|nr:Cd2+/Zn2+-exporting ATPase [Alteribacillus bidgolensis]